MELVLNATNLFMELQQPTLFLGVFYIHILWVIRLSAFPVSTRPKISQSAYSQRNNLIRNIYNAALHKSKANPPSRSICIPTSPTDATSRESM